MAEPEAIIHVAGAWDPELGQLCDRCGYVLSRSLRNAAWREGEEPPAGWGVGAEILVIEGNPTFSATVASLKHDRDTSDERPCEAAA